MIVKLCVMHFHLGAQPTSKASTLSSLCSIPKVPLKNVSDGRERKETDAFTPSVLILNSLIPNEVVGNSVMLTIPSKSSILTNHLLNVKIAVSSSSLKCLVSGWISRLYNFIT